MSHGKETPRQKMIGLMYLVLTAMLAMNVSADLLNAFVLVDSGLSQTTSNYAKKNAATYGRFVSAAELNEAKAGPWKAKADDVHKRASEIVAQIRDFKYELVSAAEPNGPALNPETKEVDGNLLDAKSDTEVPSRLMIQEKRAEKLKEMIADYRQYLLSMLNKDKDSTLYVNIERTLDTNDPPATKDGIYHTWESYRFEHIPLVAALPQLTKLQVDVLNSEADMMAYLLNQIDAGDFKFNRISAVVIPSSDYVVQGGEFEAQIFLAASDTTQRPTVYIGPYDSVQNPQTGEWTYSIPRGRDNDTIPVLPNGRGIYKRAASSVGLQRWTGLIEIKAPDGTSIRKPFRHQYTVAEPSFAVSATKMNVFYRGVDNPVSVSVSGFSMDKVSVTVTNGTISRKGNNFVVKPSSQGRESVVTVFAEEGGRKKQMGSSKFRIKNVPDPIPSIFGIPASETSIDKTRLIAAQGLVAQMPPDFDFDMKFQVLGFNIGVVRDGIYRERPSNGQLITTQQRQSFQNLQAGAQVIFSDIRVKGPDGVVRTLSPKLYKIK